MTTAANTSLDSNRFQYGLRSLLALPVALAVILTPVHWFGGAYLFSAALSTGLVVGCVLAYQIARPATFLIALPGVFVGFSFALLSVVFVTHTVFNAVACLILVPIKLRPRNFAIALVLLMSGLYGFAFWEGAARFAKIRELQTRFPFVDITPRLTFEHTAVSNEAPQLTDKLAPAVVANMDTQDQSLGDARRYYSRVAALRDLHENYYSEFARAAGFGYMRIPSLTYRLIDFEQPPPLALPVRVNASGAQPTNNELYAAHQAAVFGFISPDRMGYVKTREQVAGFEVHRFSVFEIGWQSQQKATRYWQIIRLELVGLLRGKPRVYATEKLPPADHLSDVPQRGLNDFEQRALPQLTSAEDIVVDQQADRIRMLGAVRAGNTCLECHEGKRGKLLGAFSYEMVPFVEQEIAVKSDSQQ